MSRAVCSEDGGGWTLIGRRRLVRPAIRGERWRSFRREVLAALNATPEARPIANDLCDADGDFRTPGVIGKACRVDLATIDSEDRRGVAAAFGIASALAAEIVFESDDGYLYGETPAQRWQRVRRWGRVADLRRQTMMSEDAITDALNGSKRFAVGGRRDGDIARDADRRDDANVYLAALEAAIARVRRQVGPAPKHERVAWAAGVASGPTPAGAYADAISRQDFDDLTFDTTGVFPDMESALREIAELVFFSSIGCVSIADSMPRDIEQEACATTASPRSSVLPGGASSAATAKCTLSTAQCCMNVVASLQAPPSGKANRCPDPNGRLN